MTVSLRLSPHEKESTCNNIFNFINVLAGFSYLVYQFTIEFGNWDKITESYETTTETKDPETNNTNFFTQKWIVSVNDESQSQIMRLEEVCNELTLLQTIFICTMVATAVYSSIQFVCRQYKICCKACGCVDTWWSFSMCIVLFMTALQSAIGLFMIILLSPTSFLTCYKNIARYFCTISVSVFIAFFIYNVILSAISKPILTHEIQYSELTAVGENCEVDVVTEKAKRKRKIQKYADYKDNKKNTTKKNTDEVEIPLNGEGQYSDNRYTSGSDDDTV